MAERKGYNRREFLQILGASTGVAATGCGRELPEKLIPYVVQPDEIIPGVSAWYAGTCAECSAGCGVLVRTREGRALKVEGNSSHPINGGGLCALGQSSVQGLYDPDRLREPLVREANGTFKTATWETAIGLIASAIAEAASASQESVLLSKPLGLSEEVLVEEFTKKVKHSSHISYSLFGGDVFDKASEWVFGSGTRLSIDFSEADVVLGIGADYLETWRSPVEFTKGFGQRRSPDSHGKISKVFHIEPRLSLTAANADTWLMNAPGSESRILLALLKEVVRKTNGESLRAHGLAKVEKHLEKVALKELLAESGVNESDFVSLLDALLAARRSLVVCGGAAVRGGGNLRAAVLANLLNAALGNIGTSVQLTKSFKEVSSGYQQLRDFVGKAEDGKVGFVCVAGVNPAYSLPVKSGFRAALGRAGFVAYIGTHLDETARLANVVLPLSTSFEAWNDSSPREGVYNLNQPSMQPLYKSQSFGDTLLALLAAKPLSAPVKDIGSFYEYIRTQWKKRLGEGDFESKWLACVERGGKWTNEASPKSSWNLANTCSALPKEETTPSDFSLLAFPTVRSSDGAASNRPWLQELPDPLTTSVWGSWLEMHPTTAKKHGFAQGEVAQVHTADGSFEAPVFVTKNIHPQLVAVPLGQGHESLGRFASGVGANPLRVLSPNDSDGELQLLAGGVTLRKTVAQEELVITKGSDSQLGRGIFRSVPSTELGEGDHGHGKKSKHKTGHGEVAHHDPHALGPQPEPKQMYKQMPHVQYRWGMSVDLARCTGCSACVTACYAENNVPVVGKEFCAEGREMSWLRVQRYVEGPATRPVEGFMPMMCQHCSNAPCEPVCPVYATYHSDEGLNTMVYNRCVGTRYCSNNCSYKVRRFNWFDYSWPEPLNWQLNPDVSVRSVGVMEKCSFCIQRIREGENRAKNEGRTVKDGEVQPACASSCPADAIVFGDLEDESSEVAEMSRSKRSYRVFDFELNTKPAVYYQAKVTHEKNTTKKNKKG